MQHKTTKTLAAAVLALMLSTSAYAFEKPVLLQDQGSFFAGGFGGGERETVVSAGASGAESAI